MVVFELTDEYVEQGRLFVERLLTSDFTIEGAFWLYEKEAERWKLKIATREAKEHGPKYVVTRLHQIFNQYPEEYTELELIDISPIKPDNKTLGLLQYALGSTDGIIEKRFRKRGVRAQYIEDALIYYLA